MKKTRHRPRHPHRRPRQDRYLPGRRGPCRRHAIPRDPGARLRKVHRRAALLRDAGHHRAHLRHLPGQPSAGLRQGVRRHHGGGPAARRRQAARADPLRAVRADPRAQLLPSLRAGPAAGLRYRPGAPQHLRPDRRRIPRWRAPAWRCASSARRSSRAWRRSACILPGSCPAASTRRSTPRRATASSPDCPAARALADAHARLSSRACSTSSPRRSPISASAPTMYAGMVDAAAACSGTTGSLTFRDAAGADGGGRHSGARLRRISSARRAARFLPEGAVLQAHRLSRGRLPRGPAGAPECGGPLRHSAGRSPNSRSSGSAAARVVHSRLPLSLRAPDRTAARAGKDRAAAERSRDPRASTCAPAPASTRWKAWA